MTLELSGWIIIALIALVIALATLFVWHSWWVAGLVFVVSIPAVFGLLVILAFAGWMDSGSH